MAQLKELELKITDGMQKDLETPSASPTQAFNLKNLKVQNIDEKTKNALVNEKGTVRIKDLGLPDNIRNSKIIGTIKCGSYTNIIFTDFNGYNSIIRIDQENKDSEVTARILAIGYFNFGDFIEGVFCYENSELQNIYWVDGKNSLRYLNINSKDIVTDVFSIENAPDVRFNHRIIVEPIYGGGTFHSGVIQYAFSYSIKNGPETPIIDYSPLYYISEENKGSKFESTVSMSFKVSIRNPDTRFDYIKLYSIIRTTKDGTPDCKLVTEIPIK